MATRITGGPITMEMDMDDHGHRTYSVTFVVEVDYTDGTRMEGPARVRLTPGLPRPRSFWKFGGDVDIWAWCLPTCKIAPYQQINNDPVKFYTAQFTFTTKPVDREPLDQEDPFFEPHKVSGSFEAYTEVGQWDRNGIRIQTSAGEQFFGPENEWEEFRFVITVEKNTPRLGIAQWYSMNNTVNDRVLWGFPRRFIRFKAKGFSERWHKDFKFYVTTFEFSIWVRSTVNSSGDTVLTSGWDRDLRDEGTLVLAGDWGRGDQLGQWVLRQFNGKNPNPYNPAHRIRYQDPNGNICRVVLDGRGRPLVLDPTASVTDCGQCPSGAPSVWVIQGLPAVDGSPGMSFYNGSRLSHGTGCNWSLFYALPALDITLTHTGSTWRLTLSGDAVENNAGLGPSSPWIFEKASGWACTGPNTLARVSGTTAPSEVTVNPGSATQQEGNIHVEKLAESNFLTLGIPAVIGP